MFDVLLGLDPRVVTIGAAGVAVLVLALIGYAAFAARLGPQSHFKRRLAMVGGKGSGRSTERAGRDVARRREMADKLKQMEEGVKAKRRRRHQIRSEIQQAGLKITVRQYAIGSVVLGFVGLLGMMAIGTHIIAAILVGFAMGLGLPKFILGFVKKRRLKQFTLQFADALDIIVRGIQSGLPVGECLAIIGRESPQPVGAVFQEIVDNIKLGLNLEDCLNRSMERMPSQELRFFSIVLQIQQQTGGNLAETLSNLSRVLRERKKMRDKVKAMSAEANTSATIIGSLPFLITLALTLVNPGYIAILFEDTMGHILIGIGLTWMTIGILVMRKMINFDI